MATDVNCTVKADFVPLQSGNNKNIKMATTARGEERVPLLLNLEEEDKLTDGDLRQLQEEFERQYPPREAGAGEVSRERKKHYSGNEMIVAVFVVEFHTKKGE